MKIKIRSYHSIREAMGNYSSLEMEVDKITIRQLLHALSEQFGEEFRKQVFQGNNGGETLRILVLVNGRNWRNLPGQLNALLKNGDEIHLFAPAMGG